MILYGYALSSASYRVRIALNLKGLEVATVPVHLRRGEQRQPEFLQLNSQGFVPALRLDDGAVLTQSMAIIEYLEETYPQPPLLPAAPTARARVRALCQLIACDVHPLNNLRVLQVSRSAARARRECAQCVVPSLDTGRFRGARAVARSRFLLRAILPRRFPRAWPMCCLVPQVFNARRFSVDLAPYPRLVAIDAACREMPAFAAAAPERQSWEEPV